VAKHVEIEDIDELRRRAGIIDGELFMAIRALRFGDYVRLTFLGAAGAATAETLRVRITRIRGDEFRGKLVDQPASRDLSGLGAGTAIAFTASHIHSVAAGPRLTSRPSRGASIRKLMVRGD
jgi:hypothetical protein